MLLVPSTMRAIACCVVLWVMAGPVAACPPPRLEPVYPDRGEVTSQPTIWVRGSELAGLRVEGEGRKSLAYTIVEAHFASTLWIGIRVDIERGWLFVSTSTSQRRFSVEPLARVTGFPRAEIEWNDRIVFALMYETTEKDEHPLPLIALGGLLAAAVIGRRAISGLRA